MVVKRCCAYGCKAKAGGYPKFHSFPECRERCKEWLKALNRSDILADISGDKYHLLKFYYVCNAHFKKNKDTPALLVASKATSTNKSTNMEDMGTCTEETNMEDTGTNTEKTNMDDKGTWTKKTKMKDTGTSTVDLGLSRLSLSPVDIIDIQPPPSVVIPASNVPTKPTSPEPLVPVTNAPSPGLATAEPNVTRDPENVPEKLTTSPEPLAVPVAKAPSLGFNTAETDAPDNDPANPTPRPIPLEVPVAKAPSPGLDTAETDGPPNDPAKATPRSIPLEDPVAKAPNPGFVTAANVTKLPAYGPAEPTTSLKPLITDATTPGSIAEPKVTNHSTIGVGIIDKSDKSLGMPPNNAARPGNMALNEKWKNSFKSYDTRIRSTTKAAPPNAPLPGYMEKDDIWKNSFKSYDTRIRPTTTKVVPSNSNTPHLESMVAADDILKNSVTSYDSRIRPTTMQVVPPVPCLGSMVSDDIWKNLLSSNNTRIPPAMPKVPPKRRPLGCSLADDIWKDSVESYDSRIRPTLTKEVPSDMPRPGHMPVPDIWKNSVTSNDPQIRPSTSSLRNFRKNIVPTIAVQKIPTKSNVATQVLDEETNDRNASETNSPEIKLEPADDTEITIEEHPLDLNAILERKRIRSPEIKTEPVTNENTPEIKVEETALGLDDVFNAISERERSQRLDPTVNVPNLTFKLKMNLPALEQALTGNNLRRDLEKTDVEENVRTYKRKRKD